MSIKKILDESYIEKKFENLTSSSEVIQSLSHWALNHKSQHEQIVSVWFKVLKKCMICLNHAILIVNSFKIIPLFCITSLKVT